MAAMENTSSANMSKEVEITSPTNTLSRSEGIAWSSVFFLFSFFIVVGNLLTTERSFDSVFIAENVSYKMAAMENTSSANMSKEVEITSPTNTLSRSEGIAWSSVFFLFSFFIVVGNLLTIVLFAANKRARKKSLFLVINMAFADLLLGAFTLPMYIYITIKSGYQLSMTNVNWKLTEVYQISHNISLGVSLISAAFISYERFYAIYWPFRHRRVTVRTYHIFIFLSWTLTITVTAIKDVYSKSNSMRYLMSSNIFTVTCIICGCNIAIWRKFQHGDVISQQKNRYVQNVRLTKTLIFASILNLLCWIPLAIVNGIDHESVLIRMRWYIITAALNSCNAFINPLLYAMRVPEFGKVLALSCVRKRAKMNPENIKTRGNHAAVLSQETYLKAYESESNTHALKFYKNFMETKL